MMRRYSRVNLVPLLTVLLSKQMVRSSFIVCPPQRHMPTFTRLFSSSSSSSSSNVDTNTSSSSVESMRAGDIKRELESYGISTKSFLEKKELVEALKKARAEGLKPKENASTTTTTTTTTSSTTSTEADTKSRQERMREELEKCRTMTASELRQELKDRGISTASFFEKSELVNALAEARVDGINQRKGSSSGGGATSEGYAEYKDVEVLTDDSTGPRKRSAAKDQQPQGNPFAGAGGSSPFGGMGNMADMLKNMGFGGAASGANPFGGASAGSPFGGANPFGGMGGFGDAMGKAQQMMKNPKVMEIISKAQSNPQIMAKVNECMSNPASFAKYQNDPDVKELIDELRKYM